MNRRARREGRGRGTPASLRQEARERAEERPEHAFDGADGSEQSDSGDGVLGTCDPDPARSRDGVEQGSDERRYHEPADDAGRDVEEGGLARGRASRIGYTRVLSARCSPQVDDAVPP